MQKLEQKGCIMDTHMQQKTIVLRCKTLHEVAQRTMDVLQISISINKYFVCYI